MLYLAGIFLVIAILADGLGISAVSAGAAGIAKLLFVLGSAARCNRDIHGGPLPL
jgi:uncharacterized membrane protein YtjA (UPF0391 family)